MSEDFFDKYNALNTSADNADKPADTCEYADPEARRIHDALCRPFRKLDEKEQYRNDDALPERVFFRRFFSAVPGGRSLCGRTPAGCGAGRGGRIFTSRLNSASFFQFRTPFFVLFRSLYHTFSLFSISQKRFFLLKAFFLLRHILH